MRRLVAALLLSSGCAGAHSALHAELAGSPPGPPVRCIVRGEDRRFGGDERDLGVSVSGGVRKVELEDGLAIWGRAKSASGVDYSFGQRCETPKQCVDAVYLDDGKIRVYVELDTVRPASGEAMFEAQIEEASLLARASSLFSDPKKLAVFERTAKALEEAESARGSMLSILPGGGIVNDLRATTSEMSANMDLDVALPGLGLLLAEHDIFLVSPGEDEPRAFEVLRALCAGAVESGSWTEKPAK